MNWGNGISVKYFLSYSSDLVRCKDYVEMQKYDYAEDSEQNYSGVVNDEEPQPEDEEDKMSEYSVGDAPTNVGNDDVDEYKHSHGNKHTTTTRRRQ